MKEYVDFTLFRVDYYLVSRTQLDYDKDFFNEKFFKEFEDCPYEIHIIEIAKIHQEDESINESDSEDKEEEIEPIELKQTIICNDCVICLENKPNVLYLNCLHISTCKKCEELKSIFKCPLCREEVVKKYII